jgi:hypothetical protein
MIALVLRTEANDAQYRDKWTMRKVSLAVSFLSFRQQQRKQKSNRETAPATDCNAARMGRSKTSANEDNAHEPVGLE